MPGRSSELKSPGMKIPTNHCPSLYSDILLTELLMGLRSDRQWSLPQRSTELSDQDLPKSFALPAVLFCMNLPDFPGKSFWSRWNTGYTTVDPDQALSAVVQLLPLKYSGCWATTRTVIPKKVGIAIKARRNTYFFILFLPSIDWVNIYICYITLYNI